MIYFHLRLNQISVTAPGYYPVYRPTTPMAMTSTWAAGMLSTPAPRPSTDGVANKLEEAKRTRENFPETWVWETLISGYDLFTAVSN